MNKKIIIPLFLLLGCLPCSGQESRTEVCVGFRVGGRTIETAYGENAARLAEILSLLDAVREDESLELTRITFSGWASPEGGGVRNRQLAGERRAALERYVRSKTEIPDSLVERAEAGIAWERLAELVEAADLPYREEALHVLRDLPEYTYDKTGRLTDSRKKRLMELQWGRAWHDMAARFFGELRSAGTIVVTVRHIPEPEPEPAPEAEPEIVVETPVQEEPVAVTPAEPAEAVAVAEEPARKPFYMALKTNMLYDVAGVPNIGVEFYLGRNWSVGANWMYAWWKGESRHRFWRVYGGDIAVRRWFGKRAAEKPLTGHHLGIYGQAFTYDFEWGGKGYMGGEPGGSLWDGLNYAAGVEYGYSLPIGRRLNIDFTAGIGYWGGKYYEYTPLDGHYVWQGTKKRHWFGPTKAEVSLVWLLGRGNYNGKKGGVK